MRSRLKWFVVLAISVTTCFAVADEVIDIGARRELFVDQALIERLDGRAELKLHHPLPREVAITFEKPWEGNASGYPTVFQDRDVYRMYYRGHRYIIVKSADGIRWSKLSDGPVVTHGAVDSHNTVFWDPDRQRCAMYVRYFSEGEFKGLRSIGMSHSTDFKTWSEPIGLTYPNSPPQQMYTNQIAPYYRAPHLLLGFPTRFVARPLTEHAKRLEPVETRAQFVASVKESDACSGAEVTDGLLIASRDGQTFRRWDEAFLRPGPQAEGRWIYGDNYQSYGLFETKADTEGLPNEISLHFNEGSWRDEMHRLRRYTIRLDGFVSLHPPLSGGELTTKPLKFTGRRLSLNYATSAAGNLRVEIQDSAGQPIPGFSLADADELFGDSIDQIAAWKNSPDVSRLAGQEIRLHFVLRDGTCSRFNPWIETCDLYHRQTT